MTVTASIVKIIAKVKKLTVTGSIVEGIIAEVNKVKGLSNRDH